MQEMEWTRVLVWSDLVEFATGVVVEASCLANTFIYNAACHIGRSKMQAMLLSLAHTKTPFTTMKTKWMYPLAVAACIASCTTPQKEEASKKEAITETVKVEVVGTETTYSSNGTKMKGYTASDVQKTGKRPGILVVHEWWGHNAHAREKAEKLAELGYVALAVDMYGDGKQAAHPGEAGEFAGMIMGNIDEAKARFESALATLKSRYDVDSTKIGAIGFCFGGSVVLSMANDGYDLDAVAAFHAGLTLPVMPTEGIVKAKVLVANGGADPMITAQHVSDFKAAMDAAGVDYKYVEYPEAKHAFTNRGADELAKTFELTHALAYNEKADKESWEEMKSLFASAFQ